MSVKKRPAPKRLSKKEKLIEWLVDPESLSEIVKAYDVQRLEWLKAIAAERGILKPKAGLYGAAYDWLFELAYALAVEEHHGFRAGRRPATPIQDLELIRAVRKMRVKYPNDSERKISARVLGISPKQIDRKTHPANSRKVEAVWKRYLAAEKRRGKLFTK